FDQYFQQEPLEKVFIESLAAVCKDKQDGKTVYAIPLSGNVQLLTYRDDLMRGAGKDPAELGECVDPDQLLQFIKSKAACDCVHRPFLVRYKTANDISENFWEVLRAYGFQETYGPNQEIEIPLALAQKALKWLQEAHPSGKEDGFGWTVVHDLVDPQRRDAMMMLGWPVWIIPDMMQNVTDKNPVRMQKFADHPIMGSWSLGIPKTSKYADE